MVEVVAMEFLLLVPLPVLVEVAVGDEAVGAGRLRRGEWSSGAGDVTCP